MPPAASSTAFARFASLASIEEGDFFVDDQGVPVAGSTRLPPEGASPAGDLQRRVSNAALKNFYAAAHTPAAPNWRRAVAIVGMAVACWAAVFGVGALLLHG